MNEYTTIDRDAHETPPNPDTTAPPLAIANAFGEIAQLLLDAIRCGANESRKLAELRHYLLPKLLSCNVRVRNADRAVEETA